MSYLGIGIVIVTMFLAFIIYSAMFIFIKGKLPFIRKDGKIIIVNKDIIADEDFDDILVFFLVTLIGAPFLLIVVWAVWPLFLLVLLALILTYKIKGL